MKSTRFFLLIVALLALSGLSGMTQGPGGPPQGTPPGPPPIPPIIAALDANIDAKIDATEIANASAALLTLDKNTDGALTRDEVCPMPGAGQGGPMCGPAMGCKLGRPPADGVKGTCPMNSAAAPGATCPGPGMKMGRRGGPGGPGGQGMMHRMMPVMAALDANADGTIDATEAKNAPAALLTLDKNGDGVLGLDEFAPRPPMGGARGGRGMMGQGGPGMRGQGGPGGCGGRGQAN